MGYLNNVPEDKAFVLGSKKLLNIEDLLRELNLISDQTFSHYATEKHNYFADWIMHVVKYDSLAADLIKAKGDRKSTIRTLEMHIKKLKKATPTSARKKISSSTKKNVSLMEKTDPIIKEVLENSEKSFFEEQKKTEEETEEKKIIQTKINDEENGKISQTRSGHSIHDIEEILKNLSKEDVEIRNIIWKHFKWELAKEFMYGMAIGILMGFILSKLFIG
jgi:hypothetical protein